MWQQFMNHVRPFRYSAGLVIGSCSIIVVTGFSDAAFNFSLMICAIVAAIPTTASANRSVSEEFVFTPSIPTVEAPTSQPIFPPVLRPRIIVVPVT